MAINNVINTPPVFGISKGGTNASSMAHTNGTAYYDGSSVVVTDTGTSTQVLTSNGSGSAPSYQAAGGGSVFGDLSFAASVPTTLSVSGDGTTVNLGRPGALTNLFDNSAGAWYPGNGTSTPASFTAPATGVYFFGMHLNTYCDNNPVLPGGNQHQIIFFIVGTSVGYPYYTSVTRFGVPGFYGLSAPVGGYALITLQQNCVTAMTSGQVMHFQFMSSYNVGGGGVGGGAKVDGIIEGNVFGFRIS